MPNGETNNNNKKIFKSHPDESDRVSGCFSHSVISPQVKTFIMVEQSSSTIICSMFQWISQTLSHQV